MFNLGETFTQKKARLHRLETELEELRGEIDTLSKAAAIVDRQAARITTAEAVPAGSALPPEQTSGSGDIRKHFP